MLIPKGFRFFQVFLVISLSLVFLSTFPSLVQGDDWVYTGSSVYAKEYYNPNSIKIDKQNNIVKVSIKKVYTEQGKYNFLQIYKEQKLNIEKYLDIKYSIILFSFNYKKWKYGYAHTTHYSNLGTVLNDYESLIDWDDIVPDSMIEWTLIKILGDNNIVR
jgi:hypothetical protein